ncbi:cell division protein ZapA [Planococcus shenhongbingii]|uniref:Cell division protein ZapA n=1 Tax=Planococcus shenhongbingii TaxID=3058398 RepID=A0ABT8NDG9_9BACL|nr:MULTISPECIES: cell division protein ZapA [unclassified Planococcus (in: firmicutes)]MDN7245935.1 cell division protein ZapA [Planococcus sp. N017]WKA59929.1 cell division protein ZapA [Planococcus sp. N016]
MAEDHRIRTSVKIYGYTYKLVGTETSAHMQLVASMVDEKMREIHAMNPSLDSSKLAVLTAVNMVHDNLKLKEHVEQLENELRKLKG